MAVVTNYKITFRSTTNTLYTVNILKPIPFGVGTDTDVVELTAGADPLHLDWDDTHDAFQPRRRCTGTVTFVTDDMVILKQLSPDGYTDLPVVIERNNSPFFYGFVSPDSFSTEYSNTYHEVTLNLIDCVSALDYIPVHDYGSSLIYSLQTIIQQTFIDLTSKFSKYNYGKPTFIFYYSYHLYNLYVATFIRCTSLLEAETDSIGVETGYHLRNAGEVIDQILTLTGGQMVMEGTRIICRTFPYDEKVYGGGSTIAAPTVYTPVYRGTEHEIESIRGAKSLTIERRFEYTPMKLALPAFPVLSEYNTRTHTHRKDITVSANIVPVKHRHPCLTTHFYEFVHSNGNVLRQDSTRDKFLSHALFGDMLCFPYRGGATTSDLTFADAFFGAEMMDLTIGKTRKTGLVVSNNVFINHLEMCSIKSTVPRFAIQGSYIRISFDVVAIRLEEYLDANDTHVYALPYYGTTALSNHTLCFRLRVGNKYATGYNTWSTDSSSFVTITSDGDGNFGSNISEEIKDKLGFSGNGMYFYLEGKSNCDIELSILSNTEMGRQAAFYVYKSIKMEYLGLPNLNETYHPDMLKSTELINSSFSEEVSISPEFCTANAYRLDKPDGALLDSNGALATSFTTRDKTNYTNGAKAVAEEVLAENYKDFYKKRRFVLRLQTTIPYDMLLRRYISNNYSSRFVLVAKSDDYRNEQSTLTFLDCENDMQIVQQ